MESKKQESRTTKQVWRIFRFQERFELPEDMRSCKKSGLQYTKDYVSAAGGDEAVGYINQFSLLCNGDGLQNALLEGLYRKLVNMAAAHSRAKRGFLLDADDQPLTDSQIGKILNIKTADIRKYLNKYKSVKLIEKVDLPQFDLTINDDPKKDNKNDDNEEKTPQDGQKRGRGRPPKGSSEKSGKKQKPLNKSNKNRNGIENINNNEKEVEFETEEQGQSQDNGQSVGQGQAGRECQDEPPTTPATTPPIRPNKPTKTDGPGEDGKRIKAPSQPVDKPNANIVNIALHRQSQASNDFAFTMMFELGVLTVADLERIHDGDTTLTLEQAKERGNWSAAYQKAELLFPPETVSKLINQLIKRIPKSNGKTNPASFMRTCWNNLIADAKRKSKTRASPAM